MRTRTALTVAGAVGLCTAAANATWSILIVDTRTGEIGVASATCLTGLDLRELTPMLVTELGGLTAQSAGDSRGVNRTFVRDRMIEGVAPDQIVKLLADFDPGHQSRQYGMVDDLGRATTFTGAGAGGWAGGVTGQIGDLVYAVQGNVLTGDPVVALAEQAIISTPGDLPARLMAAMEAARSMGGDGRCSCAPAMPESCGSPPPEFEKSADVGYMLVARPGDFSAAYGLYDTGGLPWSLAVFDFDADSRPDVLAGLESSSTLTLLRNTTPDGSPMTVLTRQAQFPGLVDTRALLPGDFNGDGHADFLIGSATVPGVAVMMGDGTGGFSLGHTVTLPAGIVDMDCAMGGVACVSSASGEIFVLDPGDWATVATGVVGNGPAAISADPADASAAFLVLAGSEQLVRVTRTGGGIATSEPLLSGWDLVDVQAGDVDADGRTDVLTVAGSDGVAHLLVDDGVGGYAVEQFTLGRIGRNALMADFDGDGDIDPAAYTNGQANLFIIRNDENTAFTLEAEKVIGRGPRVGMAHDMNGDGLPDIVAGSSGAQGVVIGDNAAGRFADLAGTAAGDFYMQLNVANARRQDPDPVFQLQEQFDEWRADLVGRVDAVQSRTQLDAYAVPINAERGVTLNIYLEDWMGDAVTDDVNLRIRATDGDADVVVISEPQHLGGGHYRALLSHRGVAGREKLDIVADAGDRTVLLTPRPEFRAVEAPGDFDGDGVVSFFDVQAFLAAFSAGNLSADMTMDGTLDLADVQLFLSIVSAG